MTIYTYGFAITIATIVASFLIWRRARKLNYNEEHVIDMILFSLFVSLIVARIVYITGHQAQFEGQILRMLLVTYFPGLDGTGALVGGLGGFALFSYLKQWRLFPIFDCIVKGVSLGICIVMLGSFFAGSYVGTVTQQAWGVALPGYTELRHPVALYYAIFSFLIFMALVYLDKNRKRDGYISGIFFILFGLAMVVLEYFTEGGPVLFTVHLTQVLGIVSIIGGFLLLRQKETYVTA